MRSPQSDTGRLAELPAGTLRHGWAWGLCIGSTDWLTIAGSAYAAPPLAATPAEAGPPPAMGDWAKPVLGYVAEVEHPYVTGPRNVAYRLLEVFTSEVGRG